MGQDGSQQTQAQKTAPSRITGAIRWTGITLALGLTFAWFGVYETSQMPFPERAVYWTGLMAIGVISSLLVSPLVFDRWMPRSHPALQIVVTALLISAPVTIGLFVIASVGRGEMQSFGFVSMQYVYCIVISTLLTSAAWVLSRMAQMRAAPARVAAGAGATTSTFLDRLPVRMRAAEIYAVESEDHYLRVHTSAGQELILMRLADAVRELAALEGLQTHRSWWVARQGLADVVKGDGRLTLKLKSGAEAPVSRTYVKTVKDAGWL
jgi:DNA-binding LytR/AlgR family response regulator